MAPDANSGATVFGFPKYPPFRLGATRFPPDTFKGRYLHYLDVVDPRTLFTSEVMANLNLNISKMFVDDGN